jgi:hypothetical protein
MVEYIKKNKFLSASILLILSIVSLIGIYLIDSPFLYTISNIFVLICIFIISVSAVTYTSTKLNFFKVGFDFEEFNNLSNKAEKDAYVAIEKTKLLGKNIIYAALILGVAIIIGFGYSLIQFRL